MCTLSLASGIGCVPPVIGHQLQIFAVGGMYVTTNDLGGQAWFELNVIKPQIFKIVN